MFLPSAHPLNGSSPYNAPSHSEFSTGSSHQLPSPPTNSSSNSPFHSILPTSSRSDPSHSSSISPSSAFFALAIIGPSYASYPSMKSSLRYLAKESGYNGFMNCNNSSRIGTAMYLSSSKIASYSADRGIQRHLVRQRRVRCGRDKLKMISRGSLREENSMTVSGMKGL